MAGERWTIIEHGDPVEIVTGMTEKSGLARSRVIELIHAAGDRAAQALGFSQSPLILTGNAARAVDFAGLLRVAPGLEIEVVPKFLGGATPGWREDFFFLAMLSRHGRLLAADRLRALSSPSSDLAALIGRALIQMFWDNHRRPIRSYRKRSTSEFAIEGDISPENFLTPDAEGYRQIVVRYDRANEFNAVIKAAVVNLIPLVRDPETLAMLQRVSSLLGPQDSVRRLQERRLPSRSRRWQSTYDLALDVLRGFGLTFNGGSALAPGFVLDTWRVWEDLVTIAMRSMLGGQAAIAQQGFVLGSRRRMVGAAWSLDRNVIVKPDLTLDGSAHGFGALLVDAKYKGRLEKGKQRIVESDLYESLAFAMAANTPRVVLVYPKLASEAPETVGHVSLLEHVMAGGSQVWGIETEVRGISKRGGLRIFSEGLFSSLCGSPAW